MSEDDVSPYKQFLVVRADYTSRERVASENAEKSLIAGAAGALALSVTFVEKLAPDPLRPTLWVLGAGWLFLLISLAGSLLSFVLRSHAYRMARESLDDAVVAGQLDLSKVDLSAVSRRNRRLDRLNHVRLWSLFFGVLFLVAFAFYNLYAVTS